ncbi:unnamed protein product [Adineta steineri]|uniref:Uncharacterized protein n=1 Tax=Adineta steineri TaxID=433720 RepID=A0A815L1E4_9BILA|nr:unnamed protein product [Adineta steineri]
MLPKLLDSIPDNSSFANDLPAVRLIKLLSKYFTDSWQQIISNKEPLSPRSSMHVTTDQFIIFLDYEVISETSSIDQAICIIISLYVIFELQFGIHNRIIQLLYCILLKQSRALTKPLRILLNQWSFIIDEKEDKEGGDMMTTNSTNFKTITATVESVTQVEDNQTDDLPDSEEQEEIYVENTTGNSQDQTTATNIGDKDLITEYSSESSDSSSSSLSPIDPPLVIYISPTKEQQRQIASSSSSNDNTLCEVNIKQQVSATSTDRSSTISNKKTCQAKKRPASFEEPIALRVKCTRVKRQIN